MLKLKKRHFQLIAIVLILGVMAGLLLNLYGVFDKKESNPDNLIAATIDDIGYKASGDYNTGHGVKYTVKDLGEVKVKGTATDDIEISLASGISLTAGTYTFTSGLKNCGYDTYYLCLVDSSNNTHYADLENSFTLSSSGTFSLKLVIKDEAVCYQTFHPVLVTGNQSGDFYK